MQSLPNYLKEIHTITIWVLLLLSGASGITSYAGMSVMIGDAGFFWKAIAAILSFCISALIFVLWSYSYTVTPTLLWRRDVVGAAVTIIVALFLIIGVSTLSSVVGMSHHTTARMHLAAVTTVAETAVADAKARITGTDQAVTGLTALADFLEEQAEAEEQGLGGGGAGCGVRCRNLASAARGARGLAKRITKEAEALSKEFAGGDKLLGDLRDVENKLSDPAARRRFAAEKVVALNAVLAKLETGGLFAAIEQGLGPLSQSFVVAPPQNDKEREAIAGIAAMIEARGEPILAEIAELRALPPPDPIVFETPSPMELVVRFWRALIVQIAIGICLDTGPLLILAFRMIAIAAIRRGTPPSSEAPAQIWTADALIDAHETLEALKRSRRKSADPPPDEDASKGED